MIVPRDGKVEVYIVSRLDFCYGGGWGGDVVTVFAYLARIWHVVLFGPAWNGWVYRQLCRSSNGCLDGRSSNLDSGKRFNFCDWLLWKLHDTVEGNSTVEYNGHWNTAGVGSTRNLGGKGGRRETWREEGPCQGSYLSAYFHKLGGLEERLIASINCLPQNWLAWRPKALQSPLQVAILHQRRERLSSSLLLAVTTVTSQPDISPIVIAGTDIAQHPAWNRNYPTSSKWHTECQPRSKLCTRTRWSTWQSCRTSEGWWATRYLREHSWTGRKLENKTEKEMIYEGGFLDLLSRTQYICASTFLIPTDGLVGLEKTLFNKNGIKMKVP